MKAVISLKCLPCGEVLKTLVVDTAWQWEVQSWQSDLLDHRSSCLGEPPEQATGLPYLATLCACSHIDLLHLEKLYNCNWVYCRCPQFQRVKTT